ncbi:hypothetical protein [Roseisolibacter sp. H3M3-2]|uniref:hypothetical protein n=1 Tax=Roseisolibacter sp. H3M3-2 TaxID=3031323 RepID=UPI0023DBDA6E|nr:hypothetical protein [Roseisolibacter sp. H3M3-2]MDF1505144.1 hypothetical protein [Roseisolibacter sp. H3M3-2]
MTHLLRPDGTLVVRCHDVAWLWIGLALIAGSVVLPFFPPSRGSAAVGSLVMLLIGTGAFAAYSDRVAEFRPAEGRMVWTRRTLWKRERGALRLDGIEAVELVARRSRSSFTYGLDLLTGGRRFALHGSTSSGRRKFEEAGRAVAEVVGVPFLD